ncbi:MAG: hypothetical protein IKQ09_00910 [Bacteroidales bacterium]|nr:hypothetical protein [Bacteroidales bacterium]
MKKRFWLLIPLIIILIVILLYIFPVSGEMPLWLSILPPLIAIVIALLVKEVISSLFFGILSGTFIMALYSGQGPAKALGGGLLRVADTYIVGSLSDNSHIQIIVFMLMIGGMVRLITANGGMRGVVNWLSKYAKNQRSGQLITFIMDLCVFFDDYSNTLIVGNTMRPVSDKLKVSREKLSYIIDSTSAPVVAIAFVTTWIGAELSYIQDGIDVIGLDANAYYVFINSLKYSFYPILTLCFVLMLIFSQRDYGLMLRAERKARAATPDTSETADNQAENAHIADALIPLLVLIIGTIIGLFVTGYNPEIWNDASQGLFTKISATIGEANSYLSLIWSSLLSLLTAIVITICRGTLKFNKIIEEMIEGVKTMFNAVVILTMAWSISMITADMHTAEFVSQLLLKWSLSPVIVPMLTFILAALIGFSTGTSWGTMAILYPLILPASWMLCAKNGMGIDDTMPLFYNVVASVLAGAVMGDHCSPISDTTIMSSLATGCDHLQHVSTQMPYAITVGCVAVFIGVLPASLGLPSWIAFLLGLAVLAIIVRFVGKKV